MGSTRTFETNLASARLKNLFPIHIADSCAKLLLCLKGSLTENSLNDYEKAFQ